jgi:hypothetical protein
MNRSTRVRLAAFLAVPIAACGIFAGAFLPGSNQSHNLADYGASDTAQIGMEHAQGEGVQHQHNGGHERD